MESEDVFSEEDPKIVAKEFSDVLKKSGEAFSKLAEFGIAHEVYSLRMLFGYLRRTKN